MRSSEAAALEVASDMGIPTLCMVDLFSPPGDPFLDRSHYADMLTTIPADVAAANSGNAAGADLIVKGAYTQSRLRQMIFGGATSYILAESELPVIMAH